MSDQLNWMNQHLLLICRKNMEELKLQEHYTVPPEVEGLTDGLSEIKDVLAKLREKKYFLDACQCLGTAMHKRAAVWWCWQVVKSVTEEFRDVPAFSPVEEPESPEEPPEAEATDPELEHAEAEFQKILAGTRDMMASFSTDIPKPLLEFAQTFNQQPLDDVTEILGKPLDEFLQGLEKMAVPRPGLEDVEKTAPEFFPVPDGSQDRARRNHQTMMENNAMKAVYDWVLSPSEKNSLFALNAGNDAPQSPAGMLALTAYWCFGDLNPAGNPTIQVPAGLASNGIRNTLLSAVLMEGGSRTPEKRAEDFLNLGFSVATGKNNWGGTDAMENSGENIKQPSQITRTTPYRKWTPETLEK